MRLINFSLIAFHSIESTKRRPASSNQAGTRPTLRDQTKVELFVIRINTDTSLFCFVTPAQPFIHYVQFLYF
jgi:hypothetical protein